MSCRVIGRNAENLFLENIIKKLNQKKFLRLKAKYVHTKKNSIVSDFYENNGFNLLKKKGENKNYYLYLNNYSYKKNHFIKNY